MTERKCPHDQITYWDKVGNVPESMIVYPKSEYATCPICPEQPSARIEKCKFCGDELDADEAKTLPSDSDFPICEACMDWS